MAVAHCHHYAQQQNTVLHNESERYDHYERENGKNAESLRQFDWEGGVTICSNYKVAILSLYLIHNF